MLSGLQINRELGLLLPAGLLLALVCDLTLLPALLGVRLKTPPSDRGRARTSPASGPDDAVSTERYR